MKKYLHISASFDRPQLLQHLVERLAYRRHDLGYCYEKVPDGFCAFETSSTEVYVSGTLGIDTENEHINMPFITCFYFSCIKGPGDAYQLIWSNSLS